MVSKQEIRRNDPVIRAEVEKVLNERKRIVEAILPHVEALKALSSTLPYDGLNDHFVAEVRHAIYRLSSTVSTAIQYGDHTDTYVGNMAISELGDRIASDLERIESRKTGSTAA